MSKKLRQKNTKRADYSWLQKELMEKSEEKKQQFLKDSEETQETIKTKKARKEK